MADAGSDARPLHVLAVARWYPAFDDRGAGIFVADHCAALAARGVDVRVVSWEPALLARGDQVTAEHLAGLWVDAARGRPPVATPVSWGAPATPVARLRVVTRPRRGGPADLLELARAQAGPLRAFGVELDRSWPIDVVHAHTGLPDGIAALPLARTLHAPLVTTEHDHTIADRLREPETRRAYAELLGDERALIAVSSGLAGRLAAALGVGTARIDVVPNPVAVDAFPLGDPARRDPDELLWVGRIREDKGIAALLEAVAIARRDRPGLHLRVIGRASPDDLAAARRLASRHGIAEAVGFEPPADRAVVSAAMRRAGLFVHPSPFETFGIVAAEALATGLPIAATPSGGVEEILGSDGSLGEVAAAATGPALAAAIARALERREAFDPQRLRQSVVDRYAPAAVADRVLAIDDRLLGSSAPRPRAGSAPGSTVPAADAIGPLPVVVAFRRRIVEERFESLPSALGERLLAISSTTGAIDPPPDAKPRHPNWTLVDDARPIREALDPLGRPPPAGSAGRWSWLVRHPVAAVRRRWIRRGEGRVILAERRAAIGRWLAAAGRDGERVILLPLDADDLLAIEPFLGTGDELAPGGLRWLADAWDQGSAERRPARGATPDAEPRGA